MSSTTRSDGGKLWKEMMITLVYSAHGGTQTKTLFRTKLLSTFQIKDWTEPRGSGNSRRFTIEKQINLNRQSIPLWYRSRIKRKFYCITDCSNIQKYLGVSSSQVFKTASKFWITDWEKSNPPWPDFVPWDDDFVEETDTLVAVLQDGWAWECLMLINVGAVVEWLWYGIGTWGSRVRILTAIFLGRPGILVTGCGLRKGPCLFPPWQTSLVESKEKGTKNTVTWS